MAALADALAEAANKRVQVTRRRGFGPSLIIRSVTLLAWTRHSRPPDQLHILGNPPLLNRTHAPINPVRNRDGGGWDRSIVWFLTCLVVTLLARTSHSPPPARLHMVGSPPLLNRTPITTTHVHIHGGGERDRSKGWLFASIPVRRRASDSADCCSSPLQDGEDEAMDDEASDGLEDLEAAQGLKDRHEAGPEAEKGQEAGHQEASQEAEHGREAGPARAAGSWAEAAGTPNENGSPNKRKRTEDANKEPAPARDESEDDEEDEVLSMRTRFSLTCPAMYRATRTPSLTTRPTALRRARRALRRRRLLPPGWSTCTAQRGQERSTRSLLRPSSARCLA